MAEKRWHRYDMKKLRHCHLMYMVNFGPLTAEIGSTIWGTPANFNWFHVFAALLHGI